MEAFIVALFEAIIAALLTFFLGKKLVNAFTAVTASAAMLPLVLIILGGAIKIMSAPPETVATISNDTIASIIALVTGQLPGVIMSDVAGALIGAVVGGYAARKNNSWN